MYLYKLAVVLITVFAILVSKIRNEQPGCDVIKEQWEFYKEFYSDDEDRTKLPTNNFVCKANFKTKLHMCITILRSHLMRGIETFYTLTEDAENVTKKCETREVTFWWVNNTESRTLEFFKCPITKIRHQIISGYYVPKQTDFYITRGWTKKPGKTIFMLRQSNFTENLCVLGEYFWVDE